MARLFYGGVVESGRIVKPSAGDDTVRSDRVHLTTDLAEAALMALSAKGNVYEVKSIGKTVADPDGETGIDYLAKKAKIVRQFKWSEIRRYLQFRIDDEQAESEESEVREEGAVQGSRGRSGRVE